jgi:tetratricopeptide (TPR) repeat protein
VIHSVLNSLEGSPAGLRRAIGGSIPPSPAAYLSVLPLNDAPTLASEISFCAAVLLHFAPLLSHFTVLRDQFLCSLVEGRYSDARKAHAQILGTTGYSLWALEASLLLEQTEGGIEANRRALSKIAEEVVDELGRVVLHFASQRVETSLTAVAYEEAIPALLGTPPAPATPATDYLYSRTLPTFGFCKAADYSRALNLESTYSLVDRLQCLRHLASHLASSSPTHPEAESILACVTPLADRLQDPVLATSICIACKTAPPTYILPAANYLAALDAYTCGDYATSITLFTELLKSHPDRLEYYDLLLKSHIHSDSQPPTENTNTLQHSILHDMYAALCRHPNTDDALSRLLKYSYALGGTSFGSQLHAFCCEHQVTHASLRNWLIYRDIHCANITPRAAASYGNTDYRNKLIDAVTAARPNSFTALVYRSTPSNNYDATDGFTHATSDIPIARRIKLEARRRYATGNLDEAEKLYHRLGQLSPTNPLNASEAFTGQFRCLVHSDQIERAIKLAVSTYLTHRELLTSIDLQTLVDRATANGDCDSIGLFWPVLLHILYSEKNTQHLTTTNSSQRSTPSWNISPHSVRQT